MKKSALIFALIVGLLTSASTLQAQTVNMSRYINLTVANGAVINLDFMAAAEGTPVRIVSGSNTQDITVGTDWYGITSYTAGASTMKVYGDLKRFYCAGNGVNLTAIDVLNNTQLTELDCSYNLLSSLDVSKNTQLQTLSCPFNNLSSLDVSKNTQLKRLYCFANYLTSLNVSNTQLELLYCYGNNFSSQALDDIYCTLPDRTGKENGVIRPVYNSSSSYNNTVLATNAQNATSKNWKVQYADNTDIPTTGKHKCSATDIAEASAEPSLTLYPNPVADVLYLSSTARTIRVYNIDGIEVSHATDTDRIDVAHLPAGVYTVKADGTAQSADYDGAYNIRLTEGMKIDVTTSAVVRDQKATVVIDDISLAGYGFNFYRSDHSTVPMQTGENTVMFSADDHHFLLAAYGNDLGKMEVKLNGTKLAPSYPGGTSFEFDLKNNDRLEVFLKGAPTGIGTIGQACGGEAAVYRLDGTRVQGTGLSKGIYIINGKKTAINKR